MADTYPHGLFTWADLAVPDPQAASAFYSALFGWDAADQHDPEGNYVYTLLSRDGELVAGLGPQPEMMQDMPPIWNSYINVDSVDAVVEDATANGAQVIAPIMDVMDSGRMAFISDPTGAAVGLWQPGTHRGADTYLGNDVMAWNELATRDVAAARAFYGAILPWRFEKMDADPDAGNPVDYWTIHLDSKVDGDGDMDDDFNGGIIAMDENWPAEIPAHWMVYFRVADTDATLAKLTELGGNVSVPAFDTMAGRISVVNDPQGGTFSVISAPA